MALYKKLSGIIMVSLLLVSVAMAEESETVQLSTLEIDVPVEDLSSQAGTVPVDPTQYSIEKPPVNNYILQAPLEASQQPGNHFKSSSNFNPGATGTHNQAVAQTNVTSRVSANTVTEY